MEPSHQGGDVLSDGFVVVLNQQAAIVYRHGGGSAATVDSFGFAFGEEGVESGDQLLERFLKNVHPRRHGRFVHSLSKQARIIPRADFVGQVTQQLCSLRMGEVNIIRRLLVEFLQSFKLVACL